MYKSCTNPVRNPFRRRALLWPEARACRSNFPWPLPSWSDCCAYWDNSIPCHTPVQQRGWFHMNYIVWSNCFILYTSNWLIYMYTYIYIHFILPHIVFCSFQFALVSERKHHVVIDSSKVPAFKELWIEATYLEAIHTCWCSPKWTWSSPLAANETCKTDPVEELARLLCKRDAPDLERVLWETNFWNWHVSHRMIRLPQLEPKSQGVSILF